MAEVSCQVAQLGALVELHKPRNNHRSTKCAVNDTAHASDSLPSSKAAIHFWKQFKRK